MAHAPRRAKMQRMWVIRRAAAADAAPLAELAERTFRHTFAAQNRPADMDLHCARAFGPAIQAAQIADPRTLTLVAEAAGELVAYLQLGDADPPPGVAAPRPLEILRLYADARWHGSGLAHALMDAAADFAGSRGATALWLGVWEHNPRAQRFYRRLGFTVVGEQSFVLGEDVQRDLVMSVPLAAYRRSPAPSAPPAT